AKRQSPNWCRTRPSMSGSAADQKARWPPKCAFRSTVDRLTPTEPLRRAALIAFLASAVALFLISLPVRAQDNSKLRVEPVTVETQRGKEIFKAEIADTPALRQQGLMYRKEMAPDEGMLFDFGAPRPVQM